MIQGASGERPKVLVVDDEPDLRLLLQELLSPDFEVRCAASGLEALELASIDAPDVILMDVMMPGLDGISAVKRLREKEATRHIPVLMLTAANHTRERIRAFDFGADDFIGKPFDSEEVLARVRSKVKRAQQIREPKGDRYQVANLTMDLLAQEVYLDGALLDLGPVGYGILELFLRNPGAVVTRKAIMQHVWKDQDKNDRLIDAHLTSLRKKLKGFRAELQTVYGEGYRLKLSTGNPSQT